MENKFTTARAALVLSLAALLSACSTAPTVVHKASPVLRPAQLAITQAGHGPAARYVYCELSQCPEPTPKSLVTTIAALPLTTTVFQPTSKAVEVAFQFNSTRMSEWNKKLLAEAASSYTGGDIEIIARSDFVGPAGGQKKVVEARAKAMRRIVAKQTQDARIVERREVAGPTRVVEAEQARQRSGTVRFTHPIDVQLKGTPK